MVRVVIASLGGHLLERAAEDLHGGDHDLVLEPSVEQFVPQANQGARGGFAFLGSRQVLSSFRELGGKTVAELARRGADSDKTSLVAELEGKAAPPHGGTTRRPQDQPDASRRRAARQRLRSRRAGCLELVAHSSLRVRRIAVRGLCDHLEFERGIVPGGMLHVGDTQVGSVAAERGGQARHENGVAEHCGEHESSAHGRPDGLLRLEWTHVPRRARVAPVETLRDGQALVPRVRRRGDRGSGRWASKRRPALSE